MRGLGLVQRIKITCSNDHNAERTRHGTLARYRRKQTLFRAAANLRSNNGGAWHVRGPFGVWLRNAELCENTLKLQEMFASRVKLERRLVQLMILVAARLATAHYAWFIHEPHALNLGISPEVVEAIRERRTPNFTREDERVVYDITMELN